MSNRSNAEQQPVVRRYFTPKQDYEMKKVVGRGARGFVYDSEAVSSGENVIVKYVPFHDVFSHAEYAMARELSHQNIVKFHGAQASKRSVYIIMEKCDQDLLELLDQKRQFTELEAFETVLQIARALQHLHHQNIAHRDVKLENIFLKDGVTKLGDFGSVLKGERISTFAVGSMPYASPQVYDLLKNPTTAAPYDSMPADIWSLGIVLFCLITGHPPFEEPSVHDRRFMLHKAWYERRTRGVPEMKRMSMVSQQLLFHMLHPNPSARTTADKVVQSLEEVMDRLKASRAGDADNMDVSGEDAGKEDVSEETPRAVSEQAVCCTSPKEAVIVRRDGECDGDMGVGSEQAQESSLTCESSISNVCLDGGHGGGYRRSDRADGIDAGAEGECCSGQERCRVGCEEAWNSGRPRQSSVSSMTSYSSADISSVCINDGDCGDSVMSSVSWSTAGSANHGCRQRRGSFENAVSAQALDSWRGRQPLGPRPISDKNGVMDNPLKHSVAGSILDESKVPGVSNEEDLTMAMSPRKRKSF